jgi:hypothetical protein
MHHRRPCEAEIVSSENRGKRDPVEVLDVIVDRFRRCCRGGERHLRQTAPTFRIVPAARAKEHPLARRQAFSFAEETRPTGYGSTEKAALSSL